MWLQRGAGRESCRCRQSGVLKINFAFLHGGGQGSWVWQETIAELHKQSYENFSHALALDVPGCGTKRDRDTRDLTFTAIIDELVADLEAAVISNVVLVGHSQAGTVLPSLVERRPELFRRLVYVACSIPLPGQTVIEMVGDQVQGSDESTVGWPVDPKTTSMQERSEIMFCNDMDALKTVDFMKRLGSDQWPSASYMEKNWRFEHPDTVPVTYVLCQQDNILPVAWQEKFAERFHAEKILRVDAGHQVMNTQPRALAEILLREARPGNG
jgi:pimeloyl-ACP methyl ester carboxylesterase